MSMQSYYQYFIGLVSTINTSLLFFRLVPLFRPQKGITGSILILSDFDKLGIKPKFRTCLTNDTNFTD